MIEKKINLLLLIAIVFCFFSCKTGEKTTAKQLQTTESKQLRRDYYFYEAERLKNSAKYDEALEMLLLCNLIDGEDAGVHAELGGLYAALNQQKKAEFHLKKAAKLVPHDWWHSYQLLSFYIENRDLNASTTLAKQMQKFHPQNKQIYPILATLYMVKNDVKNALQAYDNLEKLTGMSEELSLEKFKLHLANSDQKRAFDEIERLIDKYPHDTRYKILKANLLLQTQQPEAAVVEFNKVQAEDPQNPLVYVGLANYYKLINEPDKSLKMIETALENNNLDIDVKVQIMGEYLQATAADSSRIKETETLLKLLVERYPLEEEAHAYYYSFLQMQQRKAEAVAEVETILNINPKNEQAWTELIQNYFSEDSIDKALKTSNEAIFNLPEKAQFYYFKGIGLFQQKKYAESIVAFQNGLPRVNAENMAFKGGFFSVMGDAFHELNQTDSAFACYEKALLAEPTNLGVMNNYAYYLSLEKKDLRKAEMLSAKTVEAEPDNSTYLDTYAWILYERGSYSLAKMYIERAINYLPTRGDNGVIYDHYGDILHKLGNTEKALEMWQKAIAEGENTEEV
ncbi:MAG: hypothetical protein LBV31_02885, partial [Prevotellaceae bacterium]|nr:hypothetical protein [Prevotellaceae bacterium]